MKQYLFVAVKWKHAASVCGVCIIGKMCVCAYTHYFNWEKTRDCQMKWTSKEKEKKKKRRFILELRENMELKEICAVALGACVLKYATLAAILTKWILSFVLKFLKKKVKKKKKIITAQRRRRRRQKHESSETRKECEQSSRIKDTEKKFPYDTSL